MSRPSAAEIGAYRAAVDERLASTLRSLDHARFDELRPVLELGIAHEEQHQELLLTDLLHAFHHNPLLPAYAPAVDRPRPGTLADSAEFVRFEGGLVAVGAGDGFAFDNERPRHRRFLEPFALGRAPLRVRDVLAFIADGGYRAPLLWLSEGFDWVRRQNVTAPAYWRVEGDEVWAFTLAGERRLDPDEPALFLSFYEADALARWCGARLPTEHEWEHALVTQAVRSSGVQAAVAAGRAPLPPFVTADERLAGAYGVGWEWTASAYDAYPGFTPEQGALGEYNGKFMVGQLVLRGGSFLTPPAHSRPTYRNFWHPETRFQATSVRLARAAA